MASSCKMMPTSIPTIQITKLVEHKSGLEYKSYCLISTSKWLQKISDGLELK